MPLGRSAGRSSPSLLAHAEDAADHNLPLLYWYAAGAARRRGPGHGAEAGGGRQGAAAAAVHGPPRRRDRHAGGDRHCSSTAPGEADDADHAARATSAACRTGCKGQRQCPMPTDWPAAFAKLGDRPRTPTSASQALAVAVDVRRPDGVRRRCARSLADAKADAAARQAALAALLDARDKRARRRSCSSSSSDPALRRRAIRGLAGVRRPEDAGRAPRRVRRRSPPPRSATPSPRSPPGRPTPRRCSTPSRRRRCPPPTCRPRSSASCATSATRRLDEQIADVWGTVRDTAGRPQEAHRRRGRRSSPPRPGRRRTWRRGRAVFAKRLPAVPHALRRRRQGRPGHHRRRTAPTSTTCWRTSSTRSAVIPKEYAATKLDLADGRVVTGIVKEETKATLTVATANETLTHPGGGRRQARRRSHAVDDAGRPDSSS